MTVCPSTNTLDYLSTKDPKDLSYKFYSAEWKYEMIGADKEFDEISKTLYSYVTELDSDEDEGEKTFEQFKDKVFDTCMGVLEKLKKDDFFKKTLGKDIFLIFSISDYDIEDEKVKEIITKLNNKEYIDEYLAWMKTWGTY